MPPTRPSVAPGVPARLVTRPVPTPQVIERRRLWQRLDALVEQHRVTLVVAPAGFGKTTLLSTWAARGDHPVSWLSLTSADEHPEHLSRGLDAAWRLDQPRGADHLDSVLVVDDVHLAGDAAVRQTLIPFIEELPEGLRIVLSGRTAPPIGVARLAASGELGRLSAEDLSFTADEVDLAGRAVGHPISADQASRLHAVTSGWPVAVRLALIARTSAASGFRPPAIGPSIPELPEYLVEHLLDSLPADLRAFVLAACTCEWLTGAVAGELGGVSNGAALLEDVIAAGLPLQRQGSLQGEPVYRWHPLMAHAGREILLRRDPDECRRLDVRAAHAIGPMDAFAASDHALRGGDPAFAAALIQSQWLAAVLRGDSDELGDLCGRLPVSWAEDPEILAVRAACRRNAGDAVGAQDLDRRASAAAPALSAVRRRRFDLTQLLARLFVVDDAEGLGVASAQALESVHRQRDLDGVLSACALLLIGWTELRLRHVRPALTVLAEASQQCVAEGLDDLAGRAKANYGFALAFAGDFAGAQSVIAEADTWDSGGATWRRSDGAIEWFTLGWVRYWSGDASGAMDAFGKAVDQGGGLVSYAQLARCWLLDAAVDAGWPETISRLEPLLDEIPDHTIQGLPWRVYRCVAQAGMLVAQGEWDQAVRILDEVISTEPVTPAANAQAAELYWRCGSVSGALGQAALLPDEAPAYLRISGLVVRAQCERREGAMEHAHALLEDALTLGAQQGLLRAFSRPDDDLAEFLAEHSDAGTRQEPFLAQALARQRALAARTTSTALSAREREVLGFLQTRMTAAEIATELYISPNTLKTHVRSIYRKLGVENRRAAVRVARGNGV